MIIGGASGGTPAMGHDGRTASIVDALGKRSIVLSA